MCVCVCVCVCVQTDLKALPPIIANRVLKRQPMNILYLKNHLMSQHRQTPAIIPPLPYTEDPTKYHHHHQQSHHCEEPLSITNERMERGKVRSHEIRPSSPSRDNHSIHHTHTLDYTYRNDCEETPMSIS